MRPSDNPSRAMNSRPSNATGTFEIAWSTMAPATAASFGTPKKAITAILYISWKPPTWPGVGIATPTTSSVVTRNEPRYPNVIWNACDVT